MAFSFQGALGGAAGGAGIASAFGASPWGVAAGLGGGALLGLTGKSRPSLPQMSFSPDSLKSYSFSDINLSRDNPQMYAELQKNAALIQQAQDILNSRSAGMTALEQRNMQQTMGDYSSRLASQGLIGDPVAEQARADQENKIHQQAAENAYNQRAQMMGQLSSMNQGQLSATQGALGQVMNANEANRQASLNRDALINGRQMQGYQAGMDQYNTQQGMYGGLLSGGLGMVANKYSMDQNQAFQAQQNELNRNAMQNMYNGGLFNKPGNSAGYGSTMPSGWLGA